MINAEQTLNDLVEWVRKWFNTYGKNAKAVIGISGGKDSTIAAGILVRALGKDRVIGVLMPNGEQADINDSFTVCNALDIPHMVVNINSAFEGLLGQLMLGISFSEGASDTYRKNKFGDTKEIYKDYSFDCKKFDDVKINMAPRLRMTTLYAVAQSVGGMVVNTCNRSEDYVGYSTKFGDSAGDFSLFANLTVQEVLQIGDLMTELPRKLIHKTPSDGLCGKTDEDNLGFTYEALDKYILTGECDDEKIKEIIDKKNVQNIHKLKSMPSFNPAYGPDYIDYFSQKRMKF